MSANILVASAEILCAKLSESITDTDGFKANPKSYIFSMTNVDIGAELDVHVVENTGEVMNLALPYYSHDSKASAPASVEEGNMTGVVGGVITLASEGLSTRERAVLATHGSFADKEAMHAAVHAAYPETNGSK